MWKNENDEPGIPRVYKKVNITYSHDPRVVNDSVAMSRREALQRKLETAVNNNIIGSLSDEQLLDVLLKVKNKLNLLCKIKFTPLMGKDLTIEGSILHMLVFLGNEFILTRLIELGIQSTVVCVLPDLEETIPSLSELSLFCQNWFLFVSLLMHGCNFFRINGSQVDCSAFGALLSYNFEFLEELPSASACPEEEEWFLCSHKLEALLRNRVDFKNLVRELPFLFQKHLTGLIDKAKLNGLNLLQYSCFRAAHGYIPWIIALCKELISLGLSVTDVVDEDQWEEFNVLGQCGVSVGDTCLHIVASSLQPNSSALLELLITEGSCVNQRNKDGRTPLHILFWEGLEVESASYFEPCALVLLRAGGNMNCKDKEGCTPSDLLRKSDLWQYVNSSQFPITDSRYSLGKYNGKEFVNNLCDAMERISEPALKENREYLFSLLAQCAQLPLPLPFHMKAALERAYAAVGSLSSRQLERSLEDMLAAGSDSVNYSNSSNNPPLNLLLPRTVCESDSPRFTSWRAISAHHDAMKLFFFQSVGLSRETASKLGDIVANCGITSEQQLALAVYRGQFHLSDLDCSEVDQNLVEISLASSFRKIQMWEKQKEKSKLMGWSPMSSPEKKNGSAEVNKSQSSAAKTILSNAMYEYFQFTQESPIDPAEIEFVRVSGSFGIMSSRHRALNKSSIPDTKQMMNGDALHPHHHDYSLVTSGSLPFNQRSIWHIVIDSLPSNDLFLGIMPIIDNTLNSLSASPMLVTVCPNFRKLCCSGYFSHSCTATSAVDALLLQQGFYASGQRLMDGQSDTWAGWRRGDVATFVFDPLIGRLNLFHRRTQTEYLSLNDSNNLGDNNLSTVEEYWCIDGLNGSLEYCAVASTSIQSVSLTLLPSTSETMLKAIDRLKSIDETVKRPVTSTFSSPQKSLSSSNPNSTVKNLERISQMLSDLEQTTDRQFQERENGSNAIHSALQIEKQVEQSPHQQTFREELVRVPKLFDQKNAIVVKLSPSQPDSSLKNRKPKKLDLQSLPGDLATFYLRVNKAKISTIPEILSNYKGREEELVRKLEKQYNTKFFS